MAKEKGARLCRCQEFNRRGGGLVDDEAANRVTDEQARVMNPPWMLVVAADQDCVAPRPWLPQREGPQFSVCETH
jgi:hypothetical protein